MKLALKTILLSGILAGILDCFSAVVFLGKMNFSGVWKFVASGYFGKDAFSGGIDMVIFGLIFHFIIALFWAVTYYFVFAKIRFFRNNSILGGLLYGLFIWLTMTFVALPFTNIPKSAFNTIGALKNVTILMICVGLPIAIITNKYKKIQI